jgi:hypothetical protein
VPIGCERGAGKQQGERGKRDLYESHSTCFRTLRGGTLAFHLST